MEKTHCSDFDGNMNVWVLEGSDFCTKNYRHSVVQAWGKDHAAATLHWADVSLKVWQYKDTAFSRKMTRHISPVILGEQKGFSEASPGYLILHKKPKAMHYHTILDFGKFLACHNLQFFVELLLVSSRSIKRIFLCLVLLGLSRVSARSKKD